jgi:hypothetical protein
VVRPVRDDALRAALADLGAALRTKFGDVPAHGPPPTGKHG